MKILINTLDCGSHSCNISTQKVSCHVECQEVFASLPLAHYSVKLSHRMEQNINLAVEMLTNYVSSTTWL